MNIPNTKYQYCRFQTPILNTVYMAREQGGTPSVVKIRRWGTRRVPLSSDLRKIITQIKTARNAALDHLSHNFWPKSHPVENINSRRAPWNPVGFTELLINFFLIRNENSHTILVPIISQTIYIIISQTSNSSIIILLSLHVLFYYHYMQMV